MIQHARQDIATAAKAVAITAAIVFIAVLLGAMAYAGWWVFTFITTNPS